MCTENFFTTFPMGIMVHKWRCYQSNRILQTKRRNIRSKLTAMEPGPDQLPEFAEARKNGKEEPNRERLRSEGLRFYADGDESIFLLLRNVPVDDPSRLNLVKQMIDSRGVDRREKHGNVERIGYDPSQRPTP